MSSVAVGDYHSVILDDGGNVWVMGGNRSGQLGVGEKLPVRPVKLKGHFTGVFCGGSSTIIIDNDGYVMGSGYNSFGQMGLGDYNNRTTFVKVPDIKDITSCSAKINTSILVDVSGSVWVSGLNTKGQLGLGEEYKNVNSFHKLPDIPPMLSACTGFSTTLFLDFNGNVWICGENKYFFNIEDNLESRYWIPKLIPNIPPISQISISIYHTLLLDDNGCVWGSGDGDGIPESTRRMGVVNLTETQKLPVAKYCIAGHGTSFILDIDGLVWCMGTNSHGQLGIGHLRPQTEFKCIDNLPIIATIITSYTHTLLVDESGNIWGCGNNNERQLGIMGEKKVSKPEIIHALPSVSIQKASKLKKSARSVI